MRRALLSIALVASVACGRRDRAPAGSESGEAAAPDRAPPGTGIVAGSVRFEGLPPPNPTIDMSGAPGCRAQYGGGAPTDFQLTVTKGMLADVLVYVKHGPIDGRQYTPPKTPVWLEQDECRYKPRIIGIMAGQTLEIRNSDPLRHVAAAASHENGRSTAELPKEGAVAAFTFAHPEVPVALSCGLHGWMHAYVGVLDHPFFATTTTDGLFRIAGLPPGEYELHAWHPQLGTRTLHVTVPDGGVTAAQITFKAKVPHT